MSRRQGHPCRPPTPPYVRFRIRRFIKDTGSAADNPAMRPTPNDQRRPSETPHSCARPRHSTRVHDRYRPMHKHVTPPDHAASDTEPGCAAASINAPDFVLSPQPDDASTPPPARREYCPLPPARATARASAFFDIIQLQNSTLGLSCSALQLPVTQPTMTSADF